MCPWLSQEEISAMPSKGAGDDTAKKRQEDRIVPRLPNRRYIIAINDD